MKNSTEIGREAAFDAALQVISGMQDQIRHIYLIVADQEAALQNKKLLAQRGSTLGIDVTAALHMVDDLWELWGSGCVLVSKPERSLLVRRALQEHLADNGKSSLTMTDGVIALIEKIVGEGLPALSQVEAPNAAEREILAVAARYEEELEANNLVEYSSALAILTSAKVLDGTGVVILDADTTAMEDGFFASAARVEYCMVEGFCETAPDRASELCDVQKTLFFATGQHTVTPGGALRFAFPAGPYSVSALIVQELARLIGTPSIATIAVASSNPLALFEAISGRIANANLRARSSLAFEQIDFGRAWCDLLAFFGESAFPDTFLASDFMLSPFSGASTQGAYACDARWRGWRGQTVDDAITDMIAFSRDEFDQIIALISEGDLLEALARYQAFAVKQLGWSEAYRAQQLQAIALAQTVYETTARLGGTTADYLAVLKEQRIAVKMETGGSHLANPDLPTITFLSYVDLAKCQPAAFGAAILCDLDAVSFSLREGHDAKDVLFEKCGMFKPHDLAHEQRTLFARCFATAKTQVIASRALTTMDGDENLPAFVLEELVDCYRSDLRDADELDRLFAIPMSLMPYATTLGDEQIGANMSRSGQPPKLEITAPVYSTGFTAQSLSGLELMQRTGSTKSEIVLSPSAIEAYLECPYLWVVGRRLKANPLDAGLGSLELGSFAHLALERFYDRLREQGILRVTSENVSDAQSLFGEVFDSALEEQPFLSPEQAVAIVKNELERAEITGLKKDLLNFIKREVRFLPHYQNAQHEFVFGADDPCDYAGIKVTGRIDRYDIDGLGNAVVIDYKGSISKAYAYGGEAADGLVLPRKVQGLIYAQILRRKMGLTPQAILYRSYKRADIFGTYDHRHLNAFQDLEGINADLCAVTDLCEVLDRVEEMIAQRLEDFAAGKIDAHPVDDDACQYCPLCDVQCSARNRLFCEGV